MSSHIISKIGLLLFVLVAIVAITSNYLSTGRFLPIAINNNFFHRRTVIYDDSQEISCRPDPPPSTTQRTDFGGKGCMIYGYPSTGGVLIKEADYLDLLFLSLPRSHESQRSPSADEEDKFCNLLRRTGATWWPSKMTWMMAQLGFEKTQEQEKVVVFGWPMDGVGVWVLRYENDSQLPEGFGRISFAMNMEEKIQLMREYGAAFVEDVTQVEELHDGSVLKPTSLGMGTCGAELQSPTRSAVEGSGDLETEPPQPIASGEP
ncbi:hypothetical protein N7462_006879 [Penicillium macrosclerotiorum]|uniref:uncharacterized protein n=1 Tax=Penicillium macrosclerotiorum TaxID=303699 RepID=UPI0025465DB2|nr:uncharacterized protein N7462_006879 [Penicillium macrosclerotiorum]KAJ5678635.1 hypothetical protein N7462_006879 [Penicillium macrosclerotiorum]